LRFLQVLTGDIEIVPGGHEIGPGVGLPLLRVGLALCLEGGHGLPERRHLILGISEQAAHFRALIGRLHELELGDVALLQERLVDLLDIAREPQALGVFFGIRLELRHL
jgi:hypothetical protein